VGEMEERKVFLDQDI